MKRSLIFILCILLITCYFPTGMSYAKTVKAKSVSLNMKEATIGIKATVTLQAEKKPAKANEKLTWSSSNPDVATVTSKGVVTGVSEGNAVITVKATKSKKIASCNITVEKYLTAKDAGTATMTQDDVINLIQNYTLSRDDITALIKENSDGGGLDWEDGTKLEQYAGQSLPMKTQYSNGKGITIEEMTITKYHYDAMHDGCFYPIKYHVETSGTFDGTIPQDYYGLMVIDLVQKDLSCANKRLYSRISTRNKDGNNRFSFSEDIYCECDYPAFIVNIEHWAE